jgi:putative membrane protein
VNNNPYANFRREDLILRDYLATDRTTLANERTLLAYVRTGLGFGVSGASSIHFFSATMTDVFGWILIAVGILVTCFGIVRFMQTKRLTAKVVERD